MVAQTPHGRCKLRQSALSERLRLLNALIVTMTVRDAHTRSTSGMSKAENFYSPRSPAIRVQAQHDRRVYSRTLPSRHEDRREAPNRNSQKPFSQADSSRKWEMRSRP